MGCARFASYFGQHVQPPSLFHIYNYGCKCKRKCNLFTHGAPRSSQELAQKCPCVPGSNVNLETLVFMERGKPEYPEKNLSVHRREPTTNSTHIGGNLTHRDAGSGNRTQAMLAGGERSHHCANPVNSASGHSSK